MGIRAAVALALLVLTGGCGTGSGGHAGPVGRTVPELDGTSWIATSITEHGQPRALAPDSQVRVDFGDGKITVNAGCNAMGGSYRLSEESQLSVSDLSSTTMGCDQALMDQDTWLSGTALAAPLLASVDGDTLTLSREGLEMVLTDRTLAAPDALLEGTTWQLDGIRTGSTVSSVPAGPRIPTFTLAADGTVTLDTGCNSGRGTATVSGSTITLGPVATTRKACADRTGRQTEAAVLAVLQGDVDWSISQKTLTLTHGDNGLVYRAAP